MRHSLIFALPLALVVATACDERALSPAAPPEHRIPPIGAPSFNLSTRTAIDPERLGLLVKNEMQYSYAAASQVQHTRHTAYVNNIVNDLRCFDANRENPYPQPCSPGDRTNREWFYYDLNTYRSRGFKVVLVFHGTGSDTTGANLPQFIANTIRPAADPNDPNVQNLDDIVIAVQPGNENNLGRALTPDDFSPFTYGATAHARGVEVGDIVTATRNALDGAGSYVPVWTPGLVTADSLENVNFLKGLIADPAARAALGGIAVHAYGQPPVEQLKHWAKLVKVVDPAGDIPLYSTETGSERLLAGNEIGGEQEVYGVLDWLTGTVEGRRYSRLYWYATQLVEPRGDWGLIRTDGTVREAGKTFRDWPRYDPNAAFSVAVSGPTADVSSDFMCMIEYGASVTGGAQPFTYSWNTTGQIQGTAGSNAWAAFYPGGVHSISVLVTDAYNNTAENSLEVESASNGFTCQ